MLIIGEISFLSDADVSGGYSIVCDCNHQMEVSGKQEFVTCPACGNKAELLELVADWWHVSDWSRLKHKVVSVDHLHPEHLRASGGRPRWPVSKKLTGKLPETLPLPGVLIAAGKEAVPKEEVSGPPASCPDHGAFEKAERRSRAAQYLNDRQLQFSTKSAVPSFSDKAQDDPSDAEIFQLLLTKGQENFYPSGSILLREGTDGDYMFAIKVGIVELTARDQLLDVLEPGSVFGEMSLLDGKPRSATAKAATDCTVVTINRQGFLELAQDHLDFLVFVLRTMSLRVRRLNDIATTLMTVGSHRNY